LDGINVRRTLGKAVMLSATGGKAAENSVDVPARGAGNYASDEEMENAQLRKELRNTTYRLVFEYIEVFYNTVRIHSHKRNYF